MVLIHEETSWQAVRVAAYLKFLTTELQHDNSVKLNQGDNSVNHHAQSDMSHMNLQPDKLT